MVNIGDGGCHVGGGGGGCDVVVGGGGGGYEIKKLG